MYFSQCLLDRIKTLHNCISKSSCSTKLFLLKNFVKIHRKIPAPEFPCNKVVGLQSATLFKLKKRLQRKCLPVNFAKFFRRPTFVENLQTTAFGNAFFI